MNLPRFPHCHLAAGPHRLEFPGPAAIMGILNLNTDSFSDPGHPDPGEALDAAAAMARAGARIVDVGAESARTGREAVGEEEEIARLRPFLEAWPDLAASLEQEMGAAPVLSVNTWRSGVVRAAVEGGADLINDIGGLVSPENARLCAEGGSALVIMHTAGEPKVPHTHVRYRDVMAEMEAFFEGHIARALGAGLPEDRILLDPGIDFAKSAPDNLRVYRELERLHRFGRPILLPVSRKTVIGEVLGEPDPARRDPGTVACLVAGMLRGAAVFRVHNVPAMASCARMIDALSSGG